MSRHQNTGSENLSGLFWGSDHLEVEVVDVEERHIIGAGKAQVEVVYTARESDTAIDGRPRLPPPCWNNLTRANLFALQVRKDIAAIQEDVDVIGLSILSGAHLALMERIAGLLRQNEMGDVLVVLGGIIPEEDILPLQVLGVTAVFGPGTSTTEIVTLIREAVAAGD